MSVLGAAAGALVLWTLADPVAGVQLGVEGGGSLESVGPGAVTVSSLLVGLAGWLLLAILERLMARAARAWTVVAAVVLALSMLGPLGTAVDTTTAATLVGMHLIVGAVLIGGLGRSARRR